MVEHSIFSDSLLEAESAYLREEIRSDHNFHEIIGTATLLGLNPSTLRGRMRKLDIQRA